MNYYLKKKNDMMDAAVKVVNVTSPFKQFTLLCINLELLFVAVASNYLSQIINLCMQSAS